MLLLGQDALVFPEPLDLVFQVPDLLFRQLTLFKVGVLHCGQLIRRGADRELSVVELLLNGHFLVTDLLDLGLQLGLFESPVPLEIVVLSP